jgi:hypothetical protein
VEGDVKDVGVEAEAAFAASDTMHSRMVAYNAVRACPDTVSFLSYE